MSLIFFFLCLLSLPVLVLVHSGSLGPYSCTSNGQLITWGGGVDPMVRLTVIFDVAYITYSVNGANKVCDTYIVNYI